MKTNLKSGLFIIGIVLFTLGVIYYKPKNTGPKKELSKKEQKIDKYFYVDFELETEDEKITLLSILKNISKDSTVFVLRDYLLNFETDSIPSDEVINTISQKYNMPNRKVAGIIFSYKYEMLTKEDIQSLNENEDSKSNPY